MAAEPVTPQTHPEHHVIELVSDHGPAARFIGRVIAEHEQCTRCEADTVTVYQGPQHGLAFDEPATPFETAPVELKLRWCRRHGHAGFDLISSDGHIYQGI
ncbi:hypothetical protein [Pseudonocardia sp. HH130630-07]|uniref:hypothetical protein n=1 Tax=Pseudonocardia sp. HH130630-07 TaxID=1690815 RepID=UPI0008153153|nr:hypothetical protein [Pseudonocardia sp. HH130630-07]ANY10525.1 hypothetical protein AFB00_29360 [Pseudonocardia sp. HH130630-07]